MMRIFRTMLMVSLSATLSAVTVASAVAHSSSAAAQPGSGAAFAVSDGKGTIDLLWFPPASRWPAGGWRVVDSTGAVAVARVQLGDPAAMSSLSIEDADAIRRLPGVLGNRQVNEKQMSNLINMVGLRAFSEPTYAHALGLSATVANVGAGARTYTVEGLDEGGNPTNLKLVTASVDGARATPLPPSPDGVQARVSLKGVALSWKPPAEDRALPVISCIVERGGEAVRAKPFVVGTQWNPSVDLIVDGNATPNAMADYKVYSVDAFGRRSEPASIRIFFPDFRALAPPMTVTAKTSAGAIDLVWTAGTSPNLAGYIVERSFLANGPWEALMSQPLTKETTQYEDDSVRGGTTYYYHVRSADGRGDLGAPSQVASGTVQNVEAPPQVTGLTADAGRTRVRLAWKPVAFPVAGYFVERRVMIEGKPTANWVRLNPNVTAEPLYDDYFGKTSATTMQYRVIAMAMDNQAGEASSAVEVTLADIGLPGQPTIASISGAGGAVTMNFAPGGEEKRTTQFLVLRSGSAKDIGLVMGDPLPASSRRYQDLYVRPGETYFYRLVAVDGAGNRSDPTDPMMVRVGEPEIAQPKAPVLKRAEAGAANLLVQFDAPPVGYSVVVEREDAAGAGWLRIAGPLKGTSSADYPPKGNAAVRYRISYVSGAGRPGPPSAEVAVTSATP